MNIKDLETAVRNGDSFLGVCFRDTYLRGADLRGAKLRDTDFRGADLQNTNLQDADLRDADFRGANLKGSNLQGARISYLTAGVQEAPQGELLAYKEVAGHLVLLKIPKEAARSCATTRKYRAEYAEVICSEDRDGKAVEEVRNEGRNLTYRVGELVFPDSWDEDRWNECSHGIHFFLTEEEARAWVS